MGKKEPENAIFLHLLSQYYEVFTGQHCEKKVDFVGRKGDEVIYIQSTYLLTDEKTKERELGNLMAIRNNYPKYVVSLDEWTSGSSINGIKHTGVGSNKANNCFRDFYLVGSKRSLFIGYMEIQFEKSLLR